MEVGRECFVEGCYGGGGSEEEGDGLGCRLVKRRRGNGVSMIVDVME